MERGSLIATLKKKGKKEHIQGRKEKRVRRIGRFLFSRKRGREGTGFLPFIIGKGEKNPFRRQEIVAIFALPRLKKKGKKLNGYFE